MSLLSLVALLFFPRLPVLPVALQFLAFGVIIVFITPRTDYFCPMAVHLVYPRVYSGYPGSLVAPTYLLL